MYVSIRMTIVKTIKSFFGNGTNFYVTQAVAMLYPDLLKRLKNSDKFARNTFYQNN